MNFVSILEKALDATCDSGLPDVCADPNAECPASGSCTCKSTHFKDGTSCTQSE